MQLWKKINELAVTKQLTIGRGAVMKGNDYAGNLVQMPVEIMEERTSTNTL